MAARLSADERVEIQVGIAADETDAEIAVRLDRARTTVSREITRGGGRSHYKVSVAQPAACRRARRPKIPKLAADGMLATIVTERLDAGWSAAAVAAHLRRDPAASTRLDGATCCAETIYAAVYANGRHGLRKDMYRKLPSRRRHRRARSRADPSEAPQRPRARSAPSHPARSRLRNEPSRATGKATS